MVINKLRGQGRKCKRVTSAKSGRGRKVKKAKKQPKAKNQLKQRWRRRKNCKTGHLLTAFFRDLSKAAEAFSVRSEFDIFAHKPVQILVHETVETIYRAIASVDHSDLEFMFPVDNDTYIDLNIRLFVRGKLTGADR